MDGPRSDYQIGHICSNGKSLAEKTRLRNRCDIFVLLTAIFVFWNVSSNLAFTEEFKNRMLCLQQKI